MTAPIDPTRTPGERGQRVSESHLRSWRAGLVHEGWQEGSTGLLVVDDLVAARATIAAQAAEIARLTAERDEAQKRARDLDAELRHHDSVADAFRTNGELWKRKTEAAEARVAELVEGLRPIADVANSYTVQTAAEDYTFTLRPRGSNRMTGLRREHLIRAARLVSDNAKDAPSEKEGERG